MSNKSILLLYHPLELDKLDHIYFTYFLEKKLDPILLAQYLTKNFFEDIFFEHTDVPRKKEKVKEHLKKYLNLLEILDIVRKSYRDSLIKHKYTLEATINGGWADEVATDSLAELIAYSLVSHTNPTNMLDCFSKLPKGKLPESYIKNTWKKLFVNGIEHLLQKAEKIANQDSPSLYDLQYIKIYFDLIKSHASKLKGGKKRVKGVNKRVIERNMIKIMNTLKSKVPEEAKDLYEDIKNRIPDWDSYEKEYLKEREENIQKSKELLEELVISESNNSKPNDIMSLLIKFRTLFKVLTKTDIEYLLKVKKRLEKENYIMKWCEYDTERRIKNSDHYPIQVKKVRILRDLSEILTNHLICLGKIPKREVYRLIDKAYETNEKH